MNYRDIKQKLWKNIVYIAKRHAGFRAVVIVWLAVYYGCRMLARAFCQKPKAAVAVLTSLCLVLMTSGSAWADSWMHGCILDLESAQNSEELTDSEEAKPKYRLDIDVAAPEGVITEGYEVSPKFAVTLTNTGLKDLTGIAVSLDSQEGCRLFFEDGEKRYEMIFPEDDSSIKLPELTEEETESKVQEDAEKDVVQPEESEAQSENSEEDFAENLEPPIEDESGKTETETETETEQPEGSETQPENSEEDFAENLEPPIESESGKTETETEAEKPEESETQPENSEEDFVENLEPPIEDESGKTETETEIEAEQPEGSEECIEQRELPDVLPAGASLVVYVALPLGIEAGSVEDTCHIQVNEIEENYSFPLLFVIEEIQKDNDDSNSSAEQENGNTEDITNPDSEDEFKTEEADPHYPDGDSGLGSADDSVISGNPDVDNTENITSVEDITNLDSAIDPILLEKENIEDINKIESVDCIKGYHQGKVFFARGDSQYIVHMSSGSTISDLYYQVGSFNGRTAVVEGIAAIAIPKNVDGRLEIYYIDESNQKVILYEEYVVSEGNKPLINYELVDRDGEKYAQIIVEDSGSVISGLNSVQLSIDGEIATESMPEPLRSVALSDGSKVLSAQQYEILLEGDAEHRFEVIAEDNNGNVTIEKFAMSGARDDIIRVVLPTSFSIILIPDDQENQLCGENIVLHNRSDFPVEVSVASVQMQVDHTIPQNVTLSQTLLASHASGVADIRKIAEDNKSCDLNMNLMLAENSDVQSYRIDEGFTENVTSFVLASGSKDNPPVEVQPYEIEKPRSSDYAVINLRGVIDQSTRNCWESGDLAVKIVFSFKKFQNDGMETGSNTAETPGIDGISDFNTKEIDKENTR